MLVRLHKFLAEAGVASRRASEQIIVAGRVAVNGQPSRELGSKVDPRHDRVTVDGVAVKPRRKLYVALNKPRGFICSRQDSLGRRRVSELLPKEWGHLCTVGRLDFASEGLIFLTNDGQFSLQLTHPRFGVRKRYFATVEGRVEPAVIRRMVRGVFHEGENLRPDKIRLLRAGSSHSLVELELSEGKNREVRRLFESQGLTVARLQRVQIGPIKLGELPSGKWRTLTEVEVKSLLSATSAAAGHAASLHPSQEPAQTDDSSERKEAWRAGARPTQGLGSGRDDSAVWKGPPRSKRDAGLRPDRAPWALTEAVVKP